MAFQSHDRARVLNAWRGYNVAAAEKAAANKGRVAGSIVSQVMGGLGLDRRRAEAEVHRVALLQLAVRALHAAYGLDQL